MAWVVGGVGSRRDRIAYAPQSRRYIVGKAAPFRIEKWEIARCEEALCRGISIGANDVLKSFTRDVTNE